MPEAPEITLGRALDVHKQLSVAHPALSRGRVWCRTCGSARAVNSESAFRIGWPKCCGYTMTIDSPEEQAAHRSRQKEGA